MTINQKEYLFYKAPKVDVCFIRGTTPIRAATVHGKRGGVSGPLDLCRGNQGERGTRDLPG